MTLLLSYLCVICLPVFILLPQLIWRSVDLWLQGSISNEGHFSRTHSWQLDSRCFHTTGEHDGAAGPKTKTQVIWRGTSSSTGSHSPWQIICFHHLHFPLPRDNFKFEFRPLPCLVSFPLSPFPHWYLYQPADRDLFQEEKDGKSAAQNSVQLSQTAINKNL